MSEASAGRQKDGSPEDLGLVHGHVAAGAPALVVETGLLDLDDPFSFLRGRMWKGLSGIVNLSDSKMADEGHDVTRNGLDVNTTGADGDGACAHVAVGDGDGPVDGPGATGASVHGEQNTETETESRNNVTAANGGQDSSVRPRTGTGAAMNFAGVAGAEASVALIHCYLRINPQLPTDEARLTNSDQANIIFRRLKLLKEQVVGVCTKNPRVFVIKVRSNVNVEDYYTTHEIEIRPGISIQPMRERPRMTEVEVKLIGMDTTDEQIRESLQHFGTIEEIKYLRIHLTSAEQADPIVRQMEELEQGRGERVATMRLTKNVPSYILIGGKKAKIWFRGQIWHCRRCFKSFKECSASGKYQNCVADVVPLHQQWAEWTSSSSSQSSGQSRRRNVGQMNLDESYQATSVIIKGVPRGKTMSDVLQWLQEEWFLTFLVMDQIVPTGSFNDFIVWNLNSRVIKLFLDSVSGSEWEDRRVFVQPWEETTPVKVAHDDNKNSDNPVYYDPNQPPARSRRSGRRNQDDPPPSSSSGMDTEQQLAALAALEPADRTMDPLNITPSVAPPPAPTPAPTPAPFIPNTALFRSVLPVDGLQYPVIAPRQDSNLPGLQAADFGRNPPVFLNNVEQSPPGDTMSSTRRESMNVSALATAVDRGQDDQDSSSAAAVATAVATDILGGVAAAAGRMFSGLGLGNGGQTMLNFDNILSDSAGTASKVREKSPAPALAESGYKKDLIDWSLECETPDEDATCDESNETDNEEVEFLGETPAKVGRAPINRQVSAHNQQVAAVASPNSPTTRVEKLKQALSNENLRKDPKTSINSDEERVSHRSRQVSRSSIPSRIVGKSRSSSVKRPRTQVASPEEASKKKKECENDCDSSIVMDRCPTHKEQPPTGPRNFQKTGSTSSSSSKNKPKPLPIPPTKDQQKLKNSSNQSPKFQETKPKKNQATPKSGDKLKKVNKSGTNEKIISSSPNLIPVINNRYSVLAKDSSPSPTRDKNVNAGN